MASLRSTVVVRPDDLSGEVSPGLTVLDALAGLGVHVTAPCGGEGTCGKCRVQARGALSAVTPTERQILAPEEIESGIRLACQARVEGDIEITVPAASRRPEMRILMGGDLREIEADPVVVKRHVALPEQTLSEAYSRLEHLRRCGNLRSDLSAELPLLRRLPGILDNAATGVTAVLHDDVLLDVEAGETTDTCFGVAVDLGTTTVVASLTDLRSGREVAHAATVNEQTQFGHDVVSRINATLEREDGLGQLMAAAHASVSKVVDEVIDKAGIQAEQVYDATLVGNATMMHLCLGIDPASLGKMPYIATLGRAVLVPPAAVGMRIHPAARVYVLPNIAGFVGADTVGAILACRLDEADGRTRLLVDIGTNCEIALRLGDRILVTSTPAGPAFEGARIASGMYAAPGAIEKVSIDGQIDCRTIGGQEARGLCGSGLVDASAELLRVGVIDMTGRMVDLDELDGQAGDAVRAGLMETKDGMAFALTTGENGTPIMLTQRDVRELQLAKGAIRSGIDLLLEHAGLGADDLDEFVIAGGFGSYIDKANAMRLGMIPKLNPDKLTFIGNGALVGARLSLLSRQLRQRGGRIADQAEHLQLAHTPDYQMRFSEAMLFD
jgi:uncharacterized 2Fe-2S/4Fe-4S cluster protein (DUF4445 family)